MHHGSSKPATVALYMNVEFAASGNTSENL